MLQLQAPSSVRASCAARASSDCSLNTLHMHPARKFSLGPAHVGNRSGITRATCGAVPFDLPAAVAKFPTLFNTNSIDNLYEASSDKITYHTSFWYDNLVKKYADLPHKLPAGCADYEKSLKIWLDAYERFEPQLLQGVANKDNDVFVVAMAPLTNTGSFLGVPASGKTSLCLGIHRFSLDLNGKVHDVWSFRSGTAEERQLLVKDPSKSGDVSHWAPGLTLYPASWPINEQVYDQAHNTIHKWMHEVWGQEPNLKVLDDIMAPDVQIYDGMSIKSTRPHGGIQSYKGAVKKLHDSYQFGGLIDLAVGTSPASNLAFVHWTHCLTHRASGKMSHVDGITLLVLDHSSRIVQMLDFSNLLDEQKPLLLQDRHPVKQSELWSR